MPSPIVTATIQSAILSLISNILAQSIKAYRSGTPLTLNPTPIITFALYSLLSTPPNYLWQGLLEDWFPSYPPPTSTTPSEKKPTPSTTQPPLSKSNLLKKFLTDQAISAPLNTLAFLAFMKGSALAASGQGASTAGLLGEVLRDFPALHLASAKLWPAVGLLSFTLIPVERRVVFGSIVALGWNVYLGLVMG